VTTSLLRQKAPHTLYVLDEPTVGCTWPTWKTHPRAAPPGQRRHSVVDRAIDLTRIAEANRDRPRPDGGTRGTVVASAPAGVGGGVGHDTWRKTALVSFMLSMLLNQELLHKG
jgi:hypothetical protein